uniref:Ig-like domain-containing protein n=1 Tax=Myripristis murdjan TaxID=586833 RepID=A0A668A696_9TELE
VCVSLFCCFIQLYSSLAPMTSQTNYLRVQVTPSAEVAEGQRVTLTCNTSCPLADSSSFIWYHNSRALSPPESHHKQLLLDPVSRQHAGNYSCAVSTHRDIKSPEETLTVKVRDVSSQDAFNRSFVEADKNLAWEFCFLKFP